MNLIRDIFCPVLSDRTIMKYNKKGVLITTPISKSQLQPNSLDLTLGDTYKKLKSNGFNILDKGHIIPGVNTKHEIEYDEGRFEVDDVSGRRYYALMPGEFVLMVSKESLNIPNGILSFVQGRSSIARLGIQTEQAGLIDAGFKGTITFEVCNQSEYPIVLYAGMRIAQLYFFKAEKASHPYGSSKKGSKYQLQIDPTGSRIHMDPELK